MPPPASETAVRPARPDELDAAGRLIVAGYRHDGYLDRDDGSYDHEYAAWLGDAAGRARSSEVLVALVGDELVGAVTWCPFGSGAAQLAREPHQGEFRTLTVAPHARGRGVARALVQACLQCAREAGLTQVVMCSLEQMQPAHRLYRSIGFVRRPDLDWEPEPGARLLGFSLDLAAADDSD